MSARRTSNEALFEPLTVIASVDHRFLVGEQLRGVVAGSPRLVLEPTARNTGPAVAVAALLAAETGPDTLVLVMPADHDIRDVDGFLSAVGAGIEPASDGLLVLFGIRPDNPATGYGYIRAGAPIRPGGRARLVESFIEKPDRQTAEALLQSPDHLWNSGIFFGAASAFLSELEQFAPDLLGCARNALRRGRSESDFLWLDEDAFAASPSISFDYAVMQRTAKAAVVPAEFGWADLGCWSALWDIAERDRDGNVAIGNVIPIRTSNSYLRTEGPPLATIGLDDVIVIATADGVLVCEKSRDQDVKQVVEFLRSQGPGRA